MVQMSSGMNDIDYQDIDDLDDLDIAPEDESNGNGLYEHFRVTVDAGQKPMRVDKFLAERITNSSRNRIQQAADAGFIFADGKPITSSYKGKGGERGNHHNDA